MKILDLSNIRNVYFIGDIHCEFSSVVNDLIVRKKLTDAVVICCGDIGMGFYREGYYHSLFRHLNGKLSAKNVVMVMFRGNHDNPDYFNDGGLPGSINDAFSRYSNMYLIPDYSIVKTNVGNILCVGGGISIDRISRELNVSYWENEQVIELDDERKKFITDNLPIDIVCSHSSPQTAKPIQKYCGSFAVFDLKLPESMFDERVRLQEIYDFLAEISKPKHWIYGHFHITLDEIINETRFHCCDMFRDERGKRGTDIYTIRRDED